MPNVFDRTINFVKEPMPDGRFRYKRIPWDSIGIVNINPEHTCGGGLSPTSVPSTDKYADTTSATAVWVDMDDLAPGSSSEVIDEVIGMSFYDSIAQFEGLFDHVNVQYVTDSSQSGECGYPRV